MEPLILKIGFFVFAFITIWAIKHTNDVKIKYSPQVYEEEIARLNAIIRELEKRLK